MASLLSLSGSFDLSAGRLQSEGVKDRSARQTESVGDVKMHQWS